jgi:hypothetical protein
MWVLSYFYHPVTESEDRNRVSVNQFQINIIVSSCTFVDKLLTVYDMLKWKTVRNDGYNIVLLKLEFALIQSYIMEWAADVCTQGNIEFYAQFYDQITY